MFKKAISTALVFALTLVFIPMPTKAQGGRPINPANNTALNSTGSQFTLKSFPSVVFEINADVATQTGNLSWNDGSDFAFVQVQSSVEDEVENHVLTVAFNSRMASTNVSITRNSPVEVIFDPPFGEFEEFLSVASLIDSSPTLGAAMRALRENVDGDRITPALVKQLCPGIVGISGDDSIGLASWIPTMQCVKTQGIVVVAATLVAVGAGIVGLSDIVGCAAGCRGALDEAKCRAACV